MLLSFYTKPSVKPICMAKLSPNEYFSFVTTGTYPLELPNKPSPPMTLKAPHELGAFSLKQETIPDSLIPRQMPPIQPSAISDTCPNFGVSVSYFVLDKGLLYRHIPSFTSLYLFLT